MAALATIAAAEVVSAPRVGERPKGRLPDEEYKAIVEGRKRKKAERNRKRDARRKNRR